MLRVTLFGGFGLERSGETLAPPASRKARLLLAYLLLHPHTEHERTFLAGLLWPDLPETTARRRLNQALWQVRQVFAGVESTRLRVWLAPDASFWLDVHMFQEKVRRGHTERGEAQIQAWKDAMALYRGPLLPGVYEDWVLLLRERLHEEYLRTLDALTDALMRKGHYEEALTTARRLVADDPLNERAHEQVIRLYALLGRREDALRQYDSLHQILADALHTRPDPRIERLVKQVRRQTMGVAYWEAPAPLFDEGRSLPLVGREEAWNKLQRLLERVRTGEGSVLAVRGESGIGKTRLLAELAQQAEWLGLPLWVTHARQEELGVPYALWRRVLHPHLTPLRVDQLALEIGEVWLATLVLLCPSIKTWLPHLPPPPRLPGEEARQRLQAALMHLLRAFTRRSPLIFILDDAQWADTPSLDALRRVADEAKNLPLFLIISFRDDDPGDERRMKAFLAQLRRAPEHIRLSHLTPQAAGQLIQAALGLSRPAPRFQQRLYQATSGHPLFILETLRALHEEGALFRNADGVWSTPWDETTVDYTELPLTSRLKELFERRLAQITPLAREVLQVAALTQKPVDVPFLRRVLDAPPQALLYATEELLHYHFLIAEGRSLRLMHDALRDTIGEMLDEEAMRSLHHRLAQAFIAQGGVAPGVLAYHLRMAGAWREAIHFHLLAAQQAQAMNAFTSALDHLDQVMALAEKVDWPDEARFEALTQREAVLDVLSLRDRQAADLEAMLDLAQGHPSREAITQWRRARFLLTVGRFEEAEQAARRALTLAQSLQDDTLALRALPVLSQSLLFCGKLQEAMALQEDLLRLARAADDPKMLARAFKEQGDVLMSLGRHVEARPYLEQALALYRQQGDPRGEADALHLLAVLVSEQGDLPLARHYYEEELRLCKAIGFLHGETRALVNVGNLDLLESRYHQALMHYDAAANLARQVQNPQAEMMILFNRSSVLLEMFGADPQALEDIEAGLAITQAIGDTVGEGHAQCLFGEYYFYQGDYERAETHFRQGIAILKETKQFWMVQQDLRTWARVYLARGEPDAALALLDEAQRVGREMGVDQIDVLACALRAQAYSQQGDADAARTWAQRALAHLDSHVGRGYLVAFLCAQVLEEVGESTQAEMAMSRAWTLLQEALAGLPPDLQAKSLEDMPDHRRILQAHRASMQKTRVRLARADAPIGRPLREDEWVEVLWTLHSPEDERVRGKVARRQHRLRRLLREASDQGGAPTVDDLAAALGVSRATIKRDLAALRRRGEPVHTRGSKRKRGSVP